MNRIIGVASTNPVKVQAVSKAVSSYWQDVNVISFKVPSGVSDMPMSSSETRIGAKNRAIRIHKELDCWLGVGNEGGISFLDGEMYLFSTTYVWDGSEGSYGGETLIKLPSHIADQIGSGTRELGDIMEEITGKENIKQKEGAVGYLTNNSLTRTDIFELSTKMALANWVKSETS